MNAASAPDGLVTAPVLIEVERSGFVESVHHALVTVTDPQGVVSAAWGDSSTVIFPRSSNKPLQAVAMVKAGLELEPELLALVCSSHSGEAFHLDAVRRILGGVGLTEDALQNTPDLPYDEVDRKRWIAEGREPVPTAQNCSGKHAGMLAACVAAGWDTATYRDVEHPLQQLMRETLAELADDEVAATGVDGCGAPVMSLSMAGLARAFGRLAVAESGTPEGIVRDAIRQAPEYVGGTRRDVTALIKGTAGLIAKDGAEACYAIGLPDGRGVSLKIADGSQRARPVLAAAVLRAMGVESEAYDTLENAVILGHGEPVGAVTAHLGRPTSGSLDGGRER